MKKVQEETEDKVEQLKSMVSFEDGVVEQRVRNSMNQMSDNFNREIHEIRSNTEKLIASLQADTSQSLAIRLEQLNKSVKSDMFYAILEESKKRKEEVLTLDSVLRNFIENIKIEIKDSTKSSLEKLSENINSSQNDAFMVKSEIEAVKSEFSRLSDQIFTEIEIAKEPLKAWTQEYVDSVSNSMTKDLRKMEKAERENMMQEIDKVKEELRKELDSVQSASSLGISAEANSIKKYVNDMITIEKTDREKNIKTFIDRLEGLSHMLQEGVTQNSEAVKALCRALVTQESAERNHSEEGILKSLNTRISGLEDLMKFYTAKATEELRSETMNFMQGESTQRQNHEEKSKASRKKIKNVIEATKDRLEVEKTMKDLIDSVVEEFTLNSIDRQKMVLANLTGN